MRGAVFEGVGGLLLDVGSGVALLFCAPLGWNGRFTLALLSTCSDLLKYIITPPLFV